MSYIHIYIYIYVVHIYIYMSYINIYIYILIYKGTKGHLIGINNFMVGWDDQMVMNRDGYELLSGIYAYITPEHLGKL